MNDIPRVIEYFYNVHCAMYMNLLIRYHQGVHIGKLVNYTKTIAFAST